MNNHDEQREQELERQQKEWPEDDERIDIIGQNGNTGEHYDIKLTGQTTKAID